MVKLSELSAISYPVMEHKHQMVCLASYDHALYFSCRFPYCAVTSRISKWVWRGLIAGEFGLIVSDDGVIGVEVRACRSS